jgi:tetratricopeptide (TPR) repeat protein
VLAPALALALLELLLRLAGIGSPATYFVQGPSPDSWVENPAFGRRFFPAGLLRVPPPTRVAVRKPPGTTRILLFGESAAMGDPKPAFGVARHLEVLLQERYPGTRFEVIAVAMTAINSHALLLMAREAVALDADHWIVFAGNNEMLGPFGAGSALGGRAISVGWVRWILAAKASRLGQAIERLAAGLGRSPEGSTRWAGPKVLAQEHVPHDSPRRKPVYHAFERNLRDMVRLGQSAGARVLLSTVAVNLRDSGPFGMANGRNVGSEDALEVTRIVDLARRAMTNAEPVLDGNALQRAAELDPDHAGVQFLLGWASLSESNRPGGLAALARARDLDTIPLRTDSRLNGIIRRVAAETGSVLVDAEGELNQASARGAAGREAFYEHVHLTPEGNHALARCFAESLSGLLPDSVRGEAMGDWASAETCAARLALTPWGRSTCAELMLQRCLDAPFTNRLDQVVQIDALAGEVLSQRRLQTPLAARAALGVFTNAIARATNDLHLRRVYAEFLDATGNLREAVVQWQQVREAMPHHPFAYVQAGSLLRRLGKLDEARPLLEQGIGMQPDWVEARLELADTLLAQRHPAEAIAACNAALRLQPGHARAHLRLANAQAANQQPALAMDSLEQAIRLDPRLWEARYLLGVEHAVAGKVELALSQFQEVVRLKPDHALGQFNLGIAYARLKRWTEAATHLSECLRLDPRNEAAQKALSQVMAIQRPGGTGARTPGEAP